MHAVAFCNGDTTIVSGGICKQVFITPINGSKVESFSSIRIGNLKVDDDRHFLYVVEAAGRRIVCYNVNNKQEIYRIEAKENILSCALSLDKRYMLLNMSFSYPELQLWDLDSRQVIKHYTGHLQEKFYIKGILGGHGQSFVASGSEDATVYIWNRSTELLTTKLSGHTSMVNCVAWSPTDSSLLVSGSDDYTVKVWDSCVRKVEVNNETCTKEEPMKYDDAEDMEDND